MNRDQMLSNLSASTAPWDIVVIGGGATGTGCAVEAASRGYRTLLLEQNDFATGTSSRSTKLIHGGVRYLQQGNLKLVRESLRERGLLLKNAPHLVRRLSFVIPHQAGWERIYYGAGLKMYDRLSGQLSLGSSRLISRKETLTQLPTLHDQRLRGGTLYYDAQFDDARLALALAQTAAQAGATVLNYVQVGALLKTQGRICGVRATDLETGRAYEVPARVVINATGVFVDAVRRLDDPEAPAMITPSQGSHLVLDRSFLPGDSALMVPRTDDGRVLFAIPWLNRVLVGTTDVPLSLPVQQPVPTAEEVDFLLTHAARYLNPPPRPEHVLSSFAGLRPLVRQGARQHTAFVPRDHTLCQSASGLLTITGGKWTTYRQMAEQTVTAAAQQSGLPARESVTRSLRLHGYLEPRQLEATPERWRAYGSEAQALSQLTAKNSSLNHALHPALPYQAAEVVWAVRHEMARTVEDVLSRRTRALLLDARASREIAPRVAALMAGELRRDENWQRNQVNSFQQLADLHLPH